MKIYQIVENIPTPVTKKDAALKKQAKHLKMKSMLAPGPLDQMVGANKAYMDKMDQTQKDADKLVFEHPSSIIKGEDLYF